MREGGVASEERSLFDQEGSEPAVKALPEDLLDQPHDL